MQLSPMLYTENYHHGYKRHAHYNVVDDYNDNNNGGGLNSQMFGLFALVLGVIFFCIIWLVACLCGGVAGWFTRGKVDGSRKGKVKYEREYDSNKDEENHNHE